MTKGSSRLSHRERIQALVTNQPVDRLPIALWRHFPMDDQDATSLVAATLAYQNTYDFDLVKVTPASSFCLKDWGAEDLWEGNPEGTRRYTKQVIQSPRDWQELPVLSPSSLFLSRQLKCLSILRKQLGPDTPLIQTIFNPLSQAKNLAGSELLLVHLRLYPDAVLKGLSTIAKTTQSFITAAAEIGIDGIFYAVQHAQAGLLSKPEFQQFGKQLDMQVLEIARDLWCNMLHLHGKNVYFDIVNDYPVNIMNWHDRETPPSLEQARQIFTGTLCGGIRRETVSLGTPADIAQEITDAVNQVNGKRLLLGTGCVVSAIAPHGNLMAARRLVDSYES